MSKASKRKHVIQEVQEISPPTEFQSIVQIVQSEGNNLHKVMNPTGEKYLVSMPTKFRKNIYVKRGDFILVEPIPEGNKVKAEIIRPLTQEHIKWYRGQNLWPKEFDKIEKRHNLQQKLDELFVNTNRLQESCHTEDSESSSESDSSD